LERLPVERYRCQWRGIVAIGEVGISGSMVYLTLLSPARHSIRGGPETLAGFTGIGVKYFNFKYFNFNMYACWLSFKFTSI
jgi:hypothetical protein